MKKEYKIDYRLNRVAVYEAAIHDISAETAEYLIKLIAKRFKISRKVAIRKLLFDARWYCVDGFTRPPKKIEEVWERRRTPSAARSYKEQADELRP